jgi:DNA-binding NtrC family response regulator
MCDDADLFAVEAFLLGDCRNRQLYPKMIKDRTRAPVIAMNETPSLEQTLDLFAAGVDDVVRKPIHVREILARVGAIRRRHESERDSAIVGELRSFLMAEILNSREFPWHCRGANGAFSNIWSITAAGA